MNTLAKLYNFFWDSLLWGFPKGRSESGLFSLRLHILSEKGGIQARSKSAELGLGQDQEIVHLI